MESINKLLKPFDGTLNQSTDVNLDMAKLLRANLDQIIELTNLTDPGVITSTKNFLNHIVNNNSNKNKVILSVPKKYGRLFPKHGTYNYVAIHRPIRHALASELYHDFDAVNCHPIIIEQLYKLITGGTDLTQLKTYNERRNNVFKTLIDVTKDTEHPMSRDDCKKLTYLFLYGGNIDNFFTNTYPVLGKLLYDNNQTMHDIYKLVNSIVKDIEKFKDIIITKFPDTWKQLPHSDKTLNRVYGKLSSLIQNVERVLIQNCSDNLAAAGFNVDEIQHDGVYIPKRNIKSDDDLKRICDIMTNACVNDFGIFLKFETKPFSKPAWVKDLKLTWQQYVSQSADDYFENLDRFNEKKAATMFYALQPDTYLYHKDLGWFAYDTHNKLTSYGKDVPTDIFCNISDTLQKEIHQHMTKLDPTSNNYTKYARLGATAIDKCGRASTIDPCCKKYLKNLYNVPDLEKRLEGNPYLFAFNNKVFNLETMSWVDIQKDDYVLMNTGYDWVEPTSQEVQLLTDLIKTIFPIEAERDTYMTILASALSGHTLEKFIVANGSGGNGKGVINELMMETMGNYGYTAPNAVLLQPIKDGANPQVANMSYKRFVVYREPDENKNISVATIKELTGGGKLNARKCNSNNTEVHLCATHLLECNQRLNLDGKLNEGIERRIVDVLFRSTFVGKPDEYPGDHVYQGNPYYKTKMFQEKYRCALLKLLLPYWEQFHLKNRILDSFIAPSILERTKQYLEDTNEIKVWFDECYKLSDNKDDVLKIADVYELFKNSSIYLNMTKAAKRRSNRKHFIEQIRTDLHLKKYYRDRCQKKEIVDKLGVTGIRNVLLGFVEQEIDEPSLDNDCDMRD